MNRKERESRIYSIYRTKSVYCRALHCDCRAIIHAGYYVIYISLHPHSCQESPHEVKENLWILALRRWYEYAGGIQRRKSNVKPSDQARLARSTRTLSSQMTKTETICTRQEELTLTVLGRPSLFDCLRQLLETRDYELIIAIASTAESQWQTEPRRDHRSLERKRKGCWE